MPTKACKTPVISNSQSLGSSYIDAGKNQRMEVVDKPPKKRMFFSK